MSIYKVIETKDKLMYYRDKKLVSIKNIPSNVLPLLEVGKTFDDSGMKLKAPTKDCIFCGKGHTHTRRVNLQRVYLCDNCYYDKNVGQIAQRLNNDTN